MVKARIVAKIPNGFEAAMDVPSLEDNQQMSLLLKGIMGAAYILLEKCEDPNAKIAIKTRFYGQVMSACEQVVRSCATAHDISTNTPQNIVDSFLRTLDDKTKGDTS